MALPEHSPPLKDHLGWTRDELAAAASEVEGFMESDAWAAIERSIEDRLRHEQLIAMRSSPTGNDPAHERMLGQWAGLRQLRPIAEGIVDAGKQAERDMRSPDREVANG